MLDPLEFIAQKHLSVSDFEALSKTRRFYLQTLSGQEDDSLPLSNRQIAKKTGIKEQSIKNELGIISRRLHLPKHPQHRRTALIMLAFAHQEQQTRFVETETSTIAS